MLPINWLGAALLLLAFTLFVLEVKFTSHGVLGAGGAVAMVLGAVMLVDSPVPELRIHWSTALAVDAAVFGDHGVPADHRGARAAQQSGDRAAKA